MFQKYGKFEVFSQDNVIIHYPFISKECLLPTQHVCKEKFSRIYSVETMSARQELPYSIIMHIIHNTLHHE